MVVSSTNLTKCIAGCLTDELLVLDSCIKCSTYMTNCTSCSAVDTCNTCVAGSTFYFS